MRRFFEKIILWTYIKIHSMMINISIALYNTEEEILKADPNDLQERDKKETRKLHRNQLLEKFYQGQRDEKYVQDYYELLKKADKFIKTSTSHQRLVAIDRHMRHLNDEEKRNEKDPYGRRYNYAGFFDENHKHAGKTLGEVIELEFEERRTKDDDYELLRIFNNKPIEAGIAKFYDAIEKSKTENTEFEVTVMKSFDFPLKAQRDDENVINKIEQLTEFLHVKKIGFEYRQLEFFIPLKFGTENIEENSIIFKEITNIKSIFVKDEYGELIGFGIIKFIKRIKHNNTHEVWKFEGIEMQNMSLPH